MNAIPSVCKAGYNNSPSSLKRNTETVKCFTDSLYFIDLLEFFGYLYFSLFVTDDDTGRVSGDPSETSSVAYSMDGEEDWIWGGEGPGYVDVQEIRAQLAFSGSLPALREIRSVVVSYGMV